jgi:hypothetical protein
MYDAGWSLRRAGKDVLCALSLGVTERAKRELCFYIRRRLEPTPSGEKRRRRLEPTPSGEKRRRRLEPAPSGDDGKRGDAGWSLRRAWVATQAGDCAERGEVATQAGDCAERGEVATQAGDCV